jgi:hypothetical protein
MPGRLAPLTAIRSIGAPSTGGRDRVIGASPEDVTPAPDPLGSAELAGVGAGS